MHTWVNISKSFVKPPGGFLPFANLCFIDSIISELLNNIYLIRALNCFVWNMKFIRKWSRDVLPPQNNYFNSWNGKQESNPVWFNSPQTLASPFRLFRTYFHSLPFLLWGQSHLLSTALILTILVLRISLVNTHSILI